jgi:serine/threonine protein kinase
MTWLSDAAVDRLCKMLDAPDLSQTRYTLDGPLARGGMGTLFVATDGELGRPVALKVLPVALAGPDGVERLRQEARILAALEHHGIVPVHDVGILPDGRVYYAMKLVRGVRLDEHVARRPPIEELLRIFERICEPVAFAHARGIIHRDLKPENIMVGPFGEVLVMDWGVARWQTASRATPGAVPAAGPATARSTRDGTIVGTPGYMAPEQASGDVASVDERADVYALGAILQFILDQTGASRGLLRRLRAVAAKACAQSPEGRYPTVDALATDVSRVRAGLTIDAYREGALERLDRFWRRYRTPILLVLAYLIMRIVLLLVARRG